MKWLNGLVAGAQAAIVAALVSLPLHSPDNVVFNTATVALATLALGIAAGLLWNLLEQRRSGRQLYTLAACAGFALAAVLAAFCEQLLSGSIKFMLPLAALAFVIAFPVPPLLASAGLPRRWQLAGTPLVVAAALAVGFGFAGVGDSQSGHVSLPGVTVTPGAASQTLTRADVAGKTFTVVPSASQLKYTVREKLSFLPNESDAVGSTNAVSGAVRLDGASQLEVDLSTLTSDQSRRDNYIRQNLFSTSPKATFVVDSIQLPASYTPGSTFTGTLSGTATIRGVTGPMTFQVQANYDGTTLQVKGTTDFTWTDFNIPPPNTQIAQVKDNVHIEMLIVAWAA